VFTSETKQEILQSTFNSDIIFYTYLKFRIKISVKPTLRSET